MSGKKIIRGLKEAVAGKAARVRYINVGQGELASSAAFAAAAAVGPVWAIEREGDRLRIEYYKDRATVGKRIKRGSRQDVLYYLKSILNNLRDVRDYMQTKEATVTIGSEVLADNIDWLDCYIDQLERKKK